MEALSKIKTEVNQFPRLTWHHLHINHGELDVPLSGQCSLKVEPSEMTASGMEYSLKPLSESFGRELKLVSQLGREADSALDAFVEEEKILVDEFTVKENSVPDTVKINLLPEENEGSIRDVVLHAESNSKGTFIFTVEKAVGKGSLGLRLRVFAEENAEVHVVLVNLLSKDFTFFEGISSFVLDNAHVKVTEVHLGGKNVFSGVRHTLAGFRAKNSGETAYVMGENQELDVNYVTHQIAKETESSFVTEGVLSGNAKKVWRGTIDFVKGCSESKGNENENVLLLTPEVTNKSLPVILCDEESVEGSHGTSIGKLGKEVLFYLQSRGVTKEDAERLMVSAKVNSVCRNINDKETVKKIQNFLGGEEE